MTDGLPLYVGGALVLTLSMTLRSWLAVTL
jgi:hypothetical protein